MGDKLETTRKLDLKKEFRELYSPSPREVSMVDVPEFNFLMVDGEGGPDSIAARQAIEALFPVAYKLKFNSKGQGRDFAVMPLEGLWWAENMNDFVTGKRDQWQWTYMIMQPQFIKAEDFAAAVAEVAQKKDLPALVKVRLAQYAEGPSAQILHIGPFSEEHANIEKVHAHIDQLGARLAKKHHEIYLSDFRRVDPAKMKTVIRQPFNQP